MSDSFSTFILTKPQLTQSNNVSEYNSLLFNKYFKAILYIILILYATIFALNLPKIYVKLLNNPCFKSLLE